MSEKYPREWQSWRELTEGQRRHAVADPVFWSGTSEEQKQRFLDEADWQEIRLVADAKRAKLESLISLDALGSHLGLTSVEVFWLMSTRKLSGGFLIDGTWKFDRRAVDSWVEQTGGLVAVRADVKAQIEQHRAAQGAPAKSSG